MAQTSDWWERCQRADFNAEEWQQQISEAAAALSTPSFGSDPLADFTSNKPFFRPFEQWKQQVDGGGVGMPSVHPARETTTLPPNNSGSTWSKRLFFEKLYPEPEPSRQDSSFIDDPSTEADDEETSTQLYHQSLSGHRARTNRLPKSSRFLHGEPRIEESGAGNLKSTGDVKTGPLPKTQRGEGRRERKRMYRLTGAFQKVKGFVSSR